MTGNRIDSLAVNYPYTGYYFTPPQASNTSGRQTTYTSTPSFKAQQEALKQHDVIEISAKQEVEKKKGLSKGAKWGIGLGLTALAAGGIYLATRGKIKSSKLSTEQLEKLATEKVKIIELPAHIEFKEAKTLEEAIKYSKETLKISSVDESFSLEALNWVNRGLTDVSNANKGRAKMPNGLKFVAEAEEFFKRKNIGKDDIVPAHISHDLENGSFGILSVEKRLFENDTLDKFIKPDLFKPNGEKVFGIKDGVLESTCTYVKGNPITLDNEMAKLVEKYYNNPASLNINDKRLIYFGLLKPSRYEKVRFNGKHLTELIHSPNNGLSTIYHEQGHLQDMAKNYLEALKQKNGVTIHWNRKDELTKEFIEQNSTLKEFFGEAEQKTIGKVSDYAQSGIGEFIAETYAKLVKGVKLDDDVMALYKKYNGPMPGVC